MTHDEARKIIDKWINHERDAEWPNEYICSLLEARAIITAAETEKRVRGETIQECINKIHGMTIEVAGNSAATASQIIELLEALKSEKHDTNRRG